MSVVPPPGPASTWRSDPDHRRRGMPDWSPHWPRTRPVTRCWCSKATPRPRVNRAVRRPDPCGGHARVSKRRDRRHARPVCRRHQAKAKGENDPAMVDGSGQWRGSDDRLAGGPLRPAVFGGDRFRLSRPFPPPDARVAHPRGPRTDRPLRAACEAQDIRHRLQTPGERLFSAEDDRILVPKLHRPDGTEEIGCDTPDPCLQRLWRQQDDGAGQHARDRRCALVRACRQPGRCGALGQANWGPRPASWAPIRATAMLPIRMAS